MTKVEILDISFIFAGFIDVWTPMNHSNLNIKSFKVYRVSESFANIYTITKSTNMKSDQTASAKLSGQGLHFAVLSASFEHFYIYSISMLF